MLKYVPKVGPEVASLNERFSSDIRGRDEKYLMPLSERVECKGMHA